MGNNLKDNIWKILAAIGFAGWGTSEIYRNKEKRKHNEKDKLFAEKLEKEHEIVETLIEKNKK